MSEPAWLTLAPLNVRDILRIGYEKYGDDRAAVATWLNRLAEYLEVTRG